MYFLSYAHSTSRVIGNRLSISRQETHESGCASCETSREVVVVSRFSINHMGG